MLVARVERGSKAAGALSSQAYGGGARFVAAGPFVWRHDDVAGLARGEAGSSCALAY
jgi:hypothetical protein